MMNRFKRRLYCRCKPLLILFGSLSLLISLFGCDWQSPAPETKQPQSTLELPDQSRYLLKRGLYTSGFTLQPQQLSDDSQLPLIQDLYEGLVRIDKDGKVQGGAAQSWQQQQYKTWTFQLRPGLRWSNGEPLTAQDFVQSWYALAVQAPDNPLSEYLRFMALENAEKVLSKEYGVEMLGIKALDAETLQITLSQPMPYLPQMLSHVALLPQYQGESNGILVSNGAYNLLYRHTTDLLLEKNPFYWDADNVSFRNVSYHALDSSDNPAKYDLVRQIAGDAQPAPPQMQQLALPTLCSYYYEFNFRHPRLAQSAVRKALTAMISLPEINSDIAHIGRINTKFLPRDMQSQQAEQSWAPTVTEQLLVQAGVDGGQPLRLRLTYEQQGIHPQLAQRLIQMLSQSDLIQIQTQAVTRQQLLQQRMQGDFDLIGSGWCADYPDPSAFFSIFHSQSANNKVAYHNPQLDELLQKSVESAVTEAERLQIYQQIEQVINQEQLVLPLFQYYSYYLIKSDLAGYANPAVTSSIYSRDLYRKINLTQSEQHPEQTEQ
ncbi:peptide ABC transporter substrate-binding protein [Testudinibacter sp. TR-2022]|uniref:peptide ABC transporter substrate-binding protein n=1 Tax=Testudinibacter sp. TR-2022 TaxID=2585029 RepID=UPI00111895BF|nr:peptide ABC transporter substrate-binding protein [Testudinibacter sp. TR-2022]TNH05909.1 peptide ABC transporter substrate-binding protein [Pasteurellaceae bacterium Phil11]TNH22756.1 peptide ABC transporter substrate-binding protein [Testudinibacter sp. TR-2022]TNH24903.1 peptide ABC transporter substrate-binding protein [Testudinibacter sp. TR-2022]